MVESSSTFQNKVHRATNNLDEFTVKMNRYYPESKADLGGYILMRLGNEKSDTKKHQKWDVLWTEYCMYINQKSQATTALANFYHRAASILN